MDGRSHDIEQVRFEIAFKYDMGVNVFKLFKFRRFKVVLDNLIEVGNLSCFN